MTIAATTAYAPLLDEDGGALGVLELLFGGDAPDDDAHLESARQQAELSLRVICCCVEQFT